MPGFDFKELLAVIKGKLELIEHDRERIQLSIDALKHAKPNYDANAMFLPEFEVMNRAWSNNYYSGSYYGVDTSYQILKQATIEDPEIAVMVLRATKMLLEFAHVQLEADLEMFEVAEQSEKGMVQ